MSRLNRRLSIAFVHQYFPGQFAHLARRFVEDGHDVVAFNRGLSDGRASGPIDGVRAIEYGHGLPQPVEGAIGGMTHFLREAGSMASEAQTLRQAGWRPDIIYSHTGWGSTSFLPDVFPRAKHIKYCEWYYNNTTRSTEFLTPAGRPLGERMATRALNLPILADIAHGDAFIAPTEWQRAQFPPIVRDRIEVVPDGVNVDQLAPNPQASYRLASGRTLTRNDRVVTYVARGADPFRGFEPFLKAVALLQQADAEVEVIIVGDKIVYYGAGVGSDGHFNEVLARTPIDPTRTHFVGTVSYEDYRSILHISSAHVYLTVPFVLSWSLLEAMGAGCAIVGSDTSPVREFIKDGETGLLANYFGPEEICDQVLRLLSQPALGDTLRRAAREMIASRWSLAGAIDQHLALCDRLLDQSAA